MGTIKSRGEGLVDFIEKYRELTILPDPQIQKILVPELNLGQMFREVSRVVRDTVEVIPLNKIGGGRMIKPDELLSTMAQS